MIHFIHPLYFHLLIGALYILLVLMLNSNHVQSGQETVNISGKKPCYMLGIFSIKLQHFIEIKL